MRRQSARYKVALFVALIVLAAVVIRSGKLDVPPLTVATTAEDESEFLFDPELVEPSGKKPWLLSTPPHTTPSQHAPAHAPTDAVNERIGTEVAEESATGLNEFSSNSSDNLPAETAAYSGFGVAGGPGASRLFDAFVAGAGNAGGSGTRGFGGGGLPPGFASTSTDQAESAESIGALAARARTLGNHIGNTSFIPAENAVEPLPAGPPPELEEILSVPQTDSGPQSLAPSDADKSSPSYAEASVAPVAQRIVNPEPASLLLLGTGLAIAARHLRKRQKPV